MQINYLHYNMGTFLTTTEAPINLDIAHLAVRTFYVASVIRFDNGY